ncbi:hybrid sensor histidine kinase/response regulator [Cohnella silvisoli]|uniref:histidine kinase n=1 Tax=Cohnella silvisoli TaxID=2873699 RepID=A0ABV1L091_9BACL|nr:ATP-binding protein [Cohnella silvisoli]MCD9025173.1 response regulator [Cohnella silvisoli]
MVIRNRADGGTTVESLSSGFRYFNRIAGITIIPIVAIAVLLGIYTYTESNKSAPPASHGVLDLSGWDFHEKGIVNLDGEWEFYRDRLISPEQFREGAADQFIYMDVPDSWYGGEPSNEGSKAEYATYRLKVKLRDNNDSYGIKITNIQMSHKLFVNGDLRGRGGNPTTSVEGYVPGDAPYTTFVQADGGEMDIVIQVADHTYSAGGGVDYIQFGLQEDMLRSGQVTFGTELSGIFILLLFGGYHISIYMMRRKDKAYLYSGLYFLSMLVLLSMNGNKLLLQLWPGVPIDVAYKMYDIGGFSNIAILGLFLHHLDRKLLTKKHLLYLVTPIVAYLIAIIVLPYSLYQSMGNLPWEYALFVVSFYFYRIVRLYIKQDGELLNRKEIALLTGMILSIAMILVVGLFYSLGWVETEVGRKIAMIAIIAFMNTLLALRLTHATEQTEKLTDQLILRDQLKDEFLANTSHELKTPLHGIQNIASYLLEEKAGQLTDKQRSELTLIQDTSTKMSALVNDLVDVVQMKHGDLRLQETVLDVHVVAQTVFQVLEFELTGKDVRWSNRIPPHTLVKADENRVRQVLYNLIHNAIKHTKSGWIEISAQSAGDLLAVSVEDTGIGIPKESHEAIFGYFEQAERSLPQDGYTGMGLGLYISRQLVERMGGSIAVERSEPGKGTRMVFTLPAVKAEGRSADEEGLFTGGQKEVAVTRESLDIMDERYEHTVLIVDDEASNIRILLNLLGDDYNVLTAFSAREALRRLEDHPNIDLMILDVMMPEMSGIDLCRTIRETRSIIELPILFATVKDSLHDIELCFRAGGNDFIAKPFDQKTLAARVRTLLSMKTSMDQALKNELAFLQAQIKPHFLYNAISSIISFCYTDGAKAAYLLSMLSRYLRFVFERDQKSMYVPLRVELELVQAYVEIEKARFGERLEFRLYEDPGLDDVRIPSLCIQPYVENAIRHGLFEKEGPGTVTLSITDGDGYIRFDIVDDGVGMADDVLYRLSAGERPGGAGIGMTNVRRRLMAIPGASITVDSALEQGTKVTVFLPKDEETAADSAAG